MDLHRIRSRSDFAALVDAEASKRVAVERLIAEDGRGRTSWTHPGYCEACGKAVRFRIHWSYSDGITPNFREVLDCPRCLLNNRQRFVAAYVDRFLESRNGGSRPVVYLHEQVTPLFRHVDAKWGRTADVLGSEYLGHELVSGDVVKGIRHEDASALSFRSESIDLVVSCDVFEHVPDYERALRETSRVLRPGGRAFVSIPFYAATDVSVRRCDLVDGRLEHRLTPAYHGNPIDPERGALVFTDFGWDVLDRMRSSCGFSDAYMLAYYGIAEGNFGGGIQFVFELIR